MEQNGHTCLYLIKIYYLCNRFYLTFKGIMKYLSLLVFLLCFNQKIEAHAGIAVEIRDGCDRYLVIGTWHSSASEIRNTVNSSNKGLYIDLNLNNSFTNCCNGSTSSEFFTFTDYTFPKQSVKWNQITNTSSTVSDLVNYFNNSFKYNSSGIKNRFTAEVVWNPGCKLSLESWLILKLPSTLKPGIVYKCRTSSTSVVETPCSSSNIFEIVFGTDISINSKSNILCNNDSILLKTSSANDLEWFRNDTLIKGPSSDSSLTIYKPGYYSVRKGGIGCKSRTSEKLEIRRTPQIYMGLDSFICSGDSILLDGGVGKSYLWSNGRKSRYIFNYGDSVNITRTDSNGCVSIDSFSIYVHPRPKAQFTIDDSLECFRNHEIVAINKSTLAQGAVQSRTWTTDGKNYLNIDTLNQAYTSANDYTIQLTIESDQGCFDSLTKAVTIYPMPKAQFTTDTTSLCERGNVFAIDYQGSISSGSISKLWSFGDGVFSTTADDTTKSYSTFGSYPVRLELVSGFDCRDTTEQILTVHAQPKAQFTIDDSLECFRNHEIVAINKSTLAQGAVQSRTWTTDGKNYLNIDTLNQAYTSANDYTIQLTIESDQGCFDSLTKAVTIYPMPKAQFTTDTTSLCERGNVFAIDYQGSISSGSISKLWSFGDGVFSTTADDTTKSYSTFGSYPVRLELVSGFDCRDTTEQILTVHAQPKAQFTIDDSLECFRNHEIVAINKSTLAQGAVQSRTWTTDGKNYLNIDTLNQAYTSANDYTIQLTIESDQGCFDSLTKAVTIYPMPKAQFTTDTTSLCERGNVFAIDYQGSISSGSISKLWSFGDGVFSTTADDTTKSYSTFGSYPVRLELVSGFDCRDTTEQILTVHAQPKAQFTIDDSLECFRNHEIVAINKSTLAQGAVQSRTWTTDGKNYLNIDTLNQAYTSANDYTIQLTIESDQGCFDSLTKAVTIYPMPKAQFTTDTTSLCERGNVFAIDYQGSISSGSISKLWSFGDGVFSTTADDTTKSYSTFGSYPVRLELVSGFDCRDTTEQILTVHAQPKAQFTIDDSLECFRNHEIVAINKSTLAQGAVQSRTWTTDGKNYLNIDTLNQAYTSANDYTIQLTIESDQGCFDSLTKAVTIYPMPKAQFTTDTTSLCERGNVFAIDYQGSISSGSISKLWSFGDGVFSTTADDTTKSYSTFGSYPVRLELVSGFDCRDTTEQILTVHAQPKAQFTIDDSLECFRNHEIVAINKSTLAQGAVQSRTWTTDGKNYLNIDTLNQAYTSANDYTIQLTIESDQGCFDSLTKAVTIYPMPKAQFTTDDVCLGKLTSFENLSNFAFGTMSSYWSFGDGNTSNEESPFHKYSSTDSFDVTLVVSTEQDCTDTIEYKKIAVIHQVPSAAFDYKKIKSWKKETQFLFSDSSIGADFLRWKIDGFSESNEDYFQFIFQDSGSKEVTLIATNEFSCSDTTSKTISVFPDLIYYIPNAITPNGDGLNDVFNVVGLGYADMYNLKIHNRWGELLFESNKISEGWDGRFMGEIVQSGVYIYIVTFRDIGSKERVFTSGNVTLIR